MSNPQEVALPRLVAQGLASPRRSEPAETVRQVLALQAQDRWSGLASITVRTRDTAPLSTE